MNKKSNNMNNLKSTLGWTVAMLILVVLTYLSVGRKANTIVDSVKVNIHSPKGKKSLLTSDEVKTMFQGYLGYDVSLAKISEVKIKELEALLGEDERIKRAEVFLDGNDAVRVAILERNIVVRIEGKSYSYYLDEDGNKISGRLGRAVRVPVVTGAIETYAKALFEDNERSNLEDVLELAKKIEEDEFLSALIEQMDISRSGKITMIPKVGREKITLTNENLEDKLYNLKVFYKDGLPKEGWSKFSTLNLDVGGQVVAEKIDNN